MLKLYKKRGRCKYLPFVYLYQNEIKKKFINRTSFGDNSNEFTPFLRPIKTIQMLLN
jgi:hypothetical protein